MIVKNEEQVVSRCLESIAEYVDEIIIVDTGSEDDTKEICARFTDKIYDFEWKDDFAAARNASFSYAMGDYIMWLDADDVISAENAKQLTDLKKTLSYKMPDVVMCKYVISFDEKGQPLFSFFRERLLKRVANFRWNGFVHECISPRGEIIYSDFAVFHKKEKPSGERNLKIFQKQISQGRKLDAREEFYYGRELYYHNMYTESAAVLEKALKMGQGNNLNEACLFLFKCYKALGKEQKAFLSLCQSLEHGPPRADILCCLANTFKDKKDYKTAIFWYESATKCTDASLKGEFDRAEYREFVPFLEMSCCYFYLNDMEKALLYHEKAKKLRPDHPSVVFNEKFFEEYKKINEQKNIKFFKKMFDNDGKIWYSK